MGIQRFLSLVRLGKGGPCGAAEQRAVHDMQYIQDDTVLTKDMASARRIYEVLTYPSDIGV
jgi:hypothetical protein